MIVCKKCNKAMSSKTATEFCKCCYPEPEEVAIEKNINKESEIASRTPFSPYADFMNNTRGRLYTSKVNGKTYSRLQVWLRENHDKGEIERLKAGHSTRYSWFDKAGWKNGRLLGNFK